MTVAQSLKNWLLTNENIELLEDVDSDFLEADMDSLGIFKQPSDTIKAYIDGSKEVTSYYYVLLRQSAKLEADRLSNIDFLEDFEDWVYEQNLAEEYPAGIGCQNIEVSNTHYMQEMDTDGAIYQVSLALTYYKQ